MPLPLIEPSLEPAVRRVVSFEVFGIAQPKGSTKSFAFKRPDQSLGTRTTSDNRKPDIDKLARGVLDALSGVLFHDDAQVIDLRVGKRYAGADEPASAAIRVQEAG
jgi:Holliday junction resolvase RusA-like endonuclease